LDVRRAEKLRFNHIDSEILSLSHQNEYHSVRSLAQELDVSLSTVHAGLTDVLGFSLRHTQWVLHLLTDELKATRVATSMKMLEILEQQELIHFAGIITGDESWFFLEYFRNRGWRLSHENARNGSHKELTRNNTCSQFSAHNGTPG
jgi:hypothetical protein